MTQGGRWADDDFQHQIQILALPDFIEVLSDSEGVVMIFHFHSVTVGNAHFVKGFGSVQYGKPHWGGVIPIYLMRALTPCSGDFLFMNCKGGEESWMSCQDFWIMRNLNPDVTVK